MAFAMRGSNLGDLIYSGCFDAFYPTTNPQQFLQSVKKIRSLKVNRVLTAHHQLNIPFHIIRKMEKAFNKLDKKGQLKQGNGIFKFDSFQVHI